MDYEQKFKDALIFGIYDWVKWLIINDHVCINQMFQNISALQLAFNYSHYEIVKLLVTLGAKGPIKIREDNFMVDILIAGNVQFNMPIHRNVHIKLDQQKFWFDQMKGRATEICIALYELPVLILLEIFDVVFPYSHRIKMATRWELAKRIRHFKQIF